MRFEAEDWVIKVRNGSYEPIHTGCGKEVTMFDSYGHASLFVSEHDEDSYCVCECAIVSPRLKEFKIITESTEES